MALTGNAAAERKLVDQFLAGDPGQASGFLGTLNQDITANKAARRAAQKGARGMNNLQLGLNKMRGIPGGNPILNPSPSQVSIPGLQQGLPGAGQSAAGPIGSAGRMSSGPTIGPGPAARPMGPIPQGIPATTSATTQIGPAGNPGAMPQAAQTAGPRALPAGAMQTAAQSADDVLGAAAPGRAGVMGPSTLGPAKPTIIQAVRNGGAQAAGVNITMGSMLRGGGVAAAGLMASQFFDGLDLGGENQTIDRAGTGALLGAGLGGGAAIALGLGTGPAGWAALGGAALFAGYKTFFGDNKTSPQKMQESVDDTRETIASLGSMYGIEGEAMQDILLQYEASTSMYLQNKDKDGLKQFMAGMGTQLPALMLAAREEQKAGDQEQERFNTMMAAQAQFAPIFEQTLTRAGQASQQAYDVSNQAATYLDQRQPQLAALYRQTAAQSQASAANLQAAYAKQMATAPITAGTTDQLQRQLAQEELMNQQLQMAGQYG